MLYKNIVIIPCYEPPHLVIDYAKELLSQGVYKVVIVNDGSNDKYLNVFKTLSTIGGVLVLSYDKNRGKGYALKHAFSYCAQNFDDNCVYATADCDGQHGVDDVLNCLKQASENQNSFILGVRNFKDKNVPIRSKFGNNSTIFTFKLLYSIKISDTQTGLRAFSHKLLNLLLDIDGERFEYEMNQIICLHKKGIKFLEVPIKTIYEKKSDDVDKRSHFKTISDSVKVYKVLFKKAKLKSFLFLLSILSIITIIILLIVFL